MLNPSVTAIMLRRTALLPIIGALCTALLACGGTAEKADDGPCTTVTPSSDQSARPIGLAAPRVQLLTSGITPHRPLHAAPDRTSTQSARFTSTTTVLTRLTNADSEDGAGTSREDQAVTVAMTARHHCTDNTDVALRFDALSATDSTLSDELGKDAGSRGGMTLGEALVPVSLRLWPNADATTTARAVLENTLATALQNLIALPTEPVGVGASWQVSRTLIGAATLQQTITATLRARDGDVLAIDLAIDESPTGSQYTVPGTGKTLQIARYSALGRGTARIDLRRTLPIGGSIDVRGARELIGGDVTRPLVQQTRYQLEWSR